MYKSLFVFICCLALLACNKEPSLIEELVQFHMECLNNSLDFPVNKNEAKDRISGILDGREFRISGNADGYKFNTYYVTRFKTTTNTTAGEVSDVLRYIELDFVTSMNVISLGLRIPILKSTYHTSIQSFFSDTKELPLASNLDTDKVEFLISIRCENKGVDVSSIYSSVVNQSIHIDDFSFYSDHDDIVYHLEVHSDVLEVANAQFNDFDHDIVKEERGDFNPIYELKIDTFIVDFTIPK